MALSTTRRAIVESYWTEYFQHLDRLAPHSANKRAAVVAKARAITFYSCKDGILCWFEEGAELKFKHRSSGLTVETMFRKLTDPVGITFEVHFPESLDVGPVYAGEVDIGRPGNLPVYFYRAVWDRDLTFKSLKSPRELVEYDRQQDEASNMSLWGMPAPRTSKTSTN